MKFLAWPATILVLALVATGLRARDFRVFAAFAFGSADVRCRFALGGKADGSFSTVLFRVLRVVRGIPSPSPASRLRDRVSTMID